MDMNAERYIWLRNAIIKSARDNDDTDVDKLTNQEPADMTEAEFDRCVDVARGS